MNIYQDIDEIIKKKNELEAEIEQLKEEYLREVPPCENKSCGFYRPDCRNHCTWTHWVTTCPEYKS